MDLQTISMVSKNFNISTRTIRYYEQLGLIQSLKMDGYAYRIFDKDSLNKLQQIIILRKLRISLKDIQLILQKKDVADAVKVFQDKIAEISDEVTALSAIKSILEEFVARLKEDIDVAVKPELLADESLLKVIDALTKTKINFREEKTMDDLKQASDRLSKLSDVRILYIPPSTVAAVQSTSGTPEYDSANDLRNFMIETGLHKLKPDLRHFGFNNPSGNTPEGNDHGYERWVTIPDDMEVHEPLKKKRFPGGLYAAHMIPMGNFEEWKLLCDWAQNNTEYEPDWGDPECMHGLLEEHLNYINQYKLSNEEIDKCLQLDLLIPIKARTK